MTTLTNLINMIAARECAVTELDACAPRSEYADLAHRTPPNPGPALQHVRDGEEVVVTEAGIPLCRMVLIDQPTRYARLVAEGVIHAPTSPKEPSAIRGRSLASWAEAARAEASRDKKA